MRMSRYVFQMVFGVGLLGLGLWSSWAVEPNEQDIALAARTMELLRQKYQKFDAAASRLLEVNRQAIASNPDLGYVEAWIRRVNDMQSNGLPSQGVYLKYLSSDPNRAREMLNKCRFAFGAQAWADAVSDPNWARELRPILIFQNRHILTLPDIGGREGFMKRLEETKGYFTVYDPNDPNDERLWKNIKRYMFERAAWAETEREMLVKKGIPEGVRRYAGEYDVMDGSREWYYGWLWTYVPKELVVSVEQVHQMEQELLLIRPDWIGFAEFIGCDTDAKRRTLREGLELTTVLADLLDR